LRWAGENPDAFRLEHGVEGACELACTIPDQELDAVTAASAATRAVSALV
jgi:hypothetical protein